VSILMLLLFVWIAQLAVVLPLMLWSMLRPEAGAPARQALPPLTVQEPAGALTLARAA
jgi:hypothetical protein